MIPPRAIVRLGLTQLVGWGVTFYLIGAPGPAMAADLGRNAATDWPWPSAHRRSY